MLTMLLGHAYMYTMQCLIYVDHVHDFILTMLHHMTLFIFTIGVKAGKDSGGGGG